ncbi:Nesprin-1, partial [Orchesella cincta]
AAWQARLQIALIENPDFHVTITQYEEALNTIQETIHRLEPVDLNQSRKTIISKLRKFTELKDSLLRMEPELATLLQTAEQLFTNATAIEKEGTFRPTIGSSERDIFITPECSVVLDRISDLNHRLKSLQKVCDAYVKHLNMFLQRAEEDPSEESQEASSTAPLLSFSDQIIEQSGRSSSALARSASPQPSNSSNEREVRDGSVIIRSGRYIMRVVRASIPIQAMILLLLGAASLIPYGEQDFLCSARNTLQSSLEPMLHYPDGPPPI